ncbi:MAG: metal-dependent transcriptional regulator [Desulfosarcinaceae bacterium]|nr:metal-dependent transcriptional regulator [Desulfosarcinaceae bacterium]
MRKHSKEAVEDYLKAIYTLEQQGGSARTTALATRLGVTPGSVTDMLKRLAAAEPRLVTYTPHRGVSLTPAGKDRAIAVLRRHRLVETFLHEILHYGWDEIHAEADVLEHHVSDRFIDALDTLLKHPGSDPHGDPIPTADGELPKSLYAPITSLPSGTTLVVKRVRSHDDDLLRYLAEKGIRPGARLRIREIAPAGGPVTVDVITTLSQEPTTVALSTETAIGILGSAHTGQ